MSDADDRRLLERIAPREKMAFETFFRAHGSGVHRFVRDLVRDDGLAEELTSDVMVEVWRSAARYGGRSRAPPWGVGIATHTGQHARRTWPTTLVPLDDLLGAATDVTGPEEAALRAEERSRLDDAL